MKIRTREELVNAIDADFSWRKKELSVLLSMIHGSRGQSPAMEALLRCAVPILYAHWEGFVKLAACSYLEYVGRKQVPYGELSKAFAAWALRSEIRKIGSTQRVSNLLPAVDLLVDRLSEPSQLPWRGGVETSNLNSEVFRDIVLSLGLDYSPYESREKLIDGTLLHYRNNIAHGRGMILDAGRYLDLQREIVGLMEDFRTQIENAALLGHFSRSPARWAAV